MKKDERKAPYSFEFVPPPPELSQHILSLYKLTYHEPADEILPAYSAQLMVSSGAGGSADFGNGLVRSHRYASLLGPMTDAHRIVMPQPLVIYGASISTYGWAAITGLPALESSNRHIDAVSALGEEPGKAALALGMRAAELSDQEVYDGLIDVVRPLARPLPEGHRKLIEATQSWLQSRLNPDVEELYGLLPYSERQVQRLVNRFFGRPPAGLKRQYRAMRAAILLSDPLVPRHMRDKVYSAFYDQAHMIREIKQFTGRTPRWLEPGRVTFASTTLKAEHRGDSTE